MKDLFVRSTGESYPDQPPIYLAVNKGYFEEEGLNVDVFDFKGDSDSVQALAGKSVHINIASPTGIVNAIQAGQPFHLSLPPIN